MSSAKDFGAPVMKIVVRTDDNVLVDGAAVSPDAIPKMLEAIDGKEGCVWFYHANPDHPPTATALRIMKMVISAKRYLELFTKEDFSEMIPHDPVLEHGRKDEANQAVQHNDPSCHELCLRTPRASRDRG